MATTTTPAEAIADRLRRTIDGPMWHGPAIRELLVDVGPREAAARPIPGAHAIWELVLHMATWADIATERLAGRRLGDPAPTVDWPPLPATKDAAAWSQAQAHLASAYERLASAASRLGESDLARGIAEKSYDAATMLQGVIEHGSYHGGQIAILKRALIDPQGSA